MKNKLGLEFYSWLCVFTNVFDINNGSSGNITTKIVIIMMIF